MNDEIACGAKGNGSFLRGGKHIDAERRIPLDDFFMRMPETVIRPNGNHRSIGGNGEEEPRG